MSDEVKSLLSDKVDILKTDLEGILKEPHSKKVNDILTGLLHTNEFFVGSESHSGDYDAERVIEELTGVLAEQNAERIKGLVLGLLKLKEAIGYQADSEKPETTEEDKKGPAYGSLVKKAVQQVYGFEGKKLKTKASDLGPKFSGDPEIEPYIQWHRVGKTRKSEVTKPNYVFSRLVKLMKDYKNEQEKKSGGTIPNTPYFRLVRGLLHTHYKERKETKPDDQIAQKALKIAKDLKSKLVGLEAITQNEGVLSRGAVESEVLVYLERHKKTIS